MYRATADRLQQSKAMNTGWPVAVCRLAAVAQPSAIRMVAPVSRGNSSGEQTPATGLAGAGDEPLLSVRLDELQAGQRLVSAIDGTTRASPIWRIPTGGKPPSRAK